MLNRYLRMEKGYDIFYQVAYPSIPICLKGKTLSYNLLCLNGKKYAYDRPNFKNLLVEGLVTLSIDI